MSDNPQNPWLDRPWSWSNNDGRIYICNPRTVICEIIPAQAGGVSPRLAKVKDKEEIAKLICRCVNAEQR